MTQRQNLLAGVSVVAMSVAAGMPAAQAQQVLLNGTPVVGSPNVTIQVAVPDDQTLTVDQGASIIVGGGVDAVIDASNGTLSVNNDGTITTATNVGISGTGAILQSLINTGAITGGNVGVSVSNITSINNSGSISGGNDGVTTTTFTNLINSGTITGTVDAGVQATTITSFTNSGTVSGGDDAVRATNLGSLTNFGTITGGGDGIDTNNLTSLFNSGTISGVLDGVEAGGTLTVTNIGSIIANNQIGISGTGAILQNLINTGTISAGNVGVSVTTISSINNSGSISGTNDGVAATTLTSLTNSGTITGTIDAGVQASTLTSLTNSGTISGGTDAIRGARIGSLTNSGTIVAGTGSAILESLAADTRLTLLPGSIIRGAIDLGGGVNTLNVGNGLSIANTFVGAAPLIGTTNGAPFAVLGNRVAVVDPTNLAAQDEVLAGLTGGIFSSVHNRLNGFGQGGVSGVTANPRPMSFGGGSKSSAMVEDVGRQAWVQGFGSYRLQRGQEGPAVDTDIRLGGVVSGFDGATGSGGRAGFFFGGSWGDVDADYDSQETDVESVYGGAYARWLRGNTFIDLALTVGYSDYDRERRVANNLVAGGLQTATADYDGWFLSPEVTLTRPKWVGGQRLEKSVTLRYAGLFLDGFTETGAAAPLTVNDRDIHVLQARTQLTMPMEHEGTNGSYRRSAFYVGAETRANVGDDDVSGALLGQTINFDPGGDDLIGALFAGLQFERTSSGGTTLYGSIEGQVESGGGRQATGKAGVKFRF